MHNRIQILLRVPQDSKVPKDLSVPLKSKNLEDLGRFTLSKEAEELSSCMNHGTINTRFALLEHLLKQVYYTADDKNFNSPSSSRMGGAHSNAMPVPYSGKQFTVVAKDDISHITKPNPT